MIKVHRFNRSLLTSLLSFLHLFTSACKTLLALKKIRRKAHERSPRRDDIQGLRAVAIASVLLFHMWPNRFPHGYLGVDVFFVISGYLMAGVLLRERRIGLGVAARFYFRRIRRIVPMYLTVICIVLLLSAQLLFYVDVEGVLNEARYALTFSTNVKSFFQERPDDYFKQVFNYQLFLHTWSLGVEIQFYLIAPLLFTFALSLRHGGMGLFVGMLVVTSFLAQVFSRKDVAFGVLFCRIWQFSVGITGFILAEPSAKDPVRTDKELEGYAIVTRSRTVRRITGPLVVGFYSALLALLFTLLLPHEQYATIAQLVVTVATMFLMVLGRHVHSAILSSTPMTFIGDISYTVYLVHWPLFVLWKYWTDDQDTAKNAAVQISLTVAISYSLEHFIEPFFRRIPDWPTLLRLLLALYTVNIAAYVILSTQADNTPYLVEARTGPLDQLVRQLNEPLLRLSVLPLLTTETKIAINVQHRQYDYYLRNCPDRFPYFYQFSKNIKATVWQCRVKGNGTKRALLIGNSHAKQMFDVVVDVFREDYQTLHFFAVPGCLPYLGLNEYSWCNGVGEAFWQVVEYVWPQVLLIIHRHETDNPIRFGVGERPQDNPHFVAYQRFLDSLHESVEVIYFGDPDIEVGFQPGVEVAKRLWQRRPLAGIHYQLEDHFRKNADAYRLISALNCSKCLRIDWTNAFCTRALPTTSPCHLYDEETELSYFDDGDHLSVHGALKMRPHLYSLRMLYKSKLNIST